MIVIIDGFNVSSRKYIQDQLTVLLLFVTQKLLVTKFFQQNLKKYSKSGGTEFEIFRRYFSREFFL